MNRRNKNKAAASAAVKPEQSLKQAQAPSPANPKPSLESIPLSLAKQGLNKSTLPTLPQVSVSPSLSSSEQLRREWKKFEQWLSARRADRDKRLSDRLKELMSVKGKSKLQQQPGDMSSFELSLNLELAEQARAEWLKRLSAVGLNEEDWADITEDEMKAVEAAFAPPEPMDLHLNQYNSSPASMPPTVVPQDWTAPVPGGWDTPVNVENKLKNKRPADASVPARSSPLSNSWNLSDEKPSLPTPESLWDMHIANRKQPSPPTPPSATVPTPETLWEMNMAKRAPPPPTPPPTEPVSPDTVSGPSLGKKLPTKQATAPIESEAAKRGRKNKSEKQATPNGLWDSHAPIVTPEPIPAIPTHTDNSFESAHNHGYMSPLLIELECDEFPLAPRDVLNDELVEESIRQWHKQAAEADIELRRQLVSMHWSSRDWDELLGSHVQEMERNARTVVGQWKDICDEEKARRLKEDKQRRIAGIRNITSGNRRWGASSPMPSMPPDAPSLTPTPPKVKSPEPLSNTQQPRKTGVKKQTATVEDATSSEWEERSSTPSLASNKPRLRQDPPETDSLWQREALGTKSVPNRTSSFWGNGATTKPETLPSSAGKKSASSAMKGHPPLQEPSSNSRVTPLPWEDPQSRQPEKSIWPSESATTADEEGPASGLSWGQGAASAWNFAKSAIVGDKPGQSGKMGNKHSPASAVNQPPSFWSGNDAMARGMSQTPTAPSFSDPSLDGRFAAWRPSRAGDPGAGSPTSGTDLTFQHLHQTDDDDDEVDEAELQNVMSMYTKSQAINNPARKKGGPPART